MEHHQLHFLYAVYKVTDLFIQSSMSFFTFTCFRIVVFHILHMCIGFMNAFVDPKSCYSNDVLIRSLVIPTMVNIQNCLLHLKLWSTG